jgi:hypothetical protein
MEGASKKQKQRMKMMQKKAQEQAKSMTQRKYLFV